MEKNFVVAICFMGSVFVYVSVMITFNMSYHLSNTLKGLLPICASCKKIRTKEKHENNQSDWEDMDKYLSENEEVQITHGLCPDCLAKLVEQDEKK